MHLTVPELGALMLVLFGVFYWLRILPATRAVLAFLGTVAIGTGGFVGRALTSIGTWLQQIGGNVTAALFGVSIAGVVFIIALAVFAYDLHPKGGSASKRTGWAAILVGVSLTSAVALIPALAPVSGWINSLLSGLVTFLGSL